MQMNPDHGVIFHVVGLGIPWALILAWIEKYGLPLLLQVLPIILPLILGGGVSPVMIGWIEAALAALAAGQPLPPLPGPVASPAVP